MKGLKTLEEQRKIYPFPGLKDLIFKKLPLHWLRKKGRLVSTKCQSGKHTTETEEIEFINEGLENWFW